MMVGCSNGRGKGGEMEEGDGAGNLSSLLHAIEHDRTADANT